MPAANRVANVQVRTQGFADGLNLQYAPDQLAPTEVRRAENGFLDERGGFTKRLGCTNVAAIGAAGDRIISVYTFNRGTLAPQLLIHTSAGRVYYTSDPTATPVVFTEIGSGGWSTTQPMSWETFNGKVYFCEGTHTMASWDSATYNANVTGAPMGKYLRLWKDTMWVAGVANQPDRVYSSAAGDAETWPVANWVDIRHGDGDRILALATDGLYLIVGKRNTGSIITDPALLDNHTFDYEKGISSHWSVVQYESTIYYMTRRGIAEWQGDSPAHLMSYKIDPLFDPRVLNFDRLEFVWAYTYQNRISWCVAEAGSLVPTLQINYSPRLAMLTALGIRGLGPWSTDRVPVACAVMWRYQAVQRLYGGATGANAFWWVFADNVGADDGNAFTAILETGSYDFGAPLLTKYIRRLRVLGRGIFNLQVRRNFEGGIIYTSTVDLSIARDQWSLADTWNAPGEHWGIEGDVQEATVNPDLYARYVQLIFRDINPNPGSMQLPVGQKDVVLPTGQWSVLACIVDGCALGIRENH